MMARPNSFPGFGFAQRVLDILPILTTLLLLSIYPALRYLPPDPFWAEIFRFLVISIWISYLILNQVRAHKTRQELLNNMEIDWRGEPWASDHGFDHYAIFMPLKR